MSVEIHVVTLGADGACRSDGPLSAPRSMTTRITTLCPAFVSSQVIHRKDCGTSCSILTATGRGLPFGSRKPDSQRSQWKKSTLVIFHATAPAATMKS